jgi:hypothetical protein
MPERYGESAEKARRAKILLREGKLGYAAVAAEVKTSKSQIQRFANELREDERLRAPDAESAYRGEETEPIWRPSLNAFDLMKAERDDFERMNTQLIADSAAVSAENRRLRARLEAA